MLWFIFACICGGGLLGMSRAQLNANQERRHNEQMDATYDAAGSYDNDSGGGGGCDSYSGGDNE